MEKSVAVCFFVPIWLFVFAWQESTYEDCQRLATALYDPM